MVDSWSISDEQLDEAEKAAELAGTDGPLEGSGEEEAWEIEEDWMRKVMWTVGAPPADTWDNVQRADSGSSFLPRELQENERAAGVLEEAGADGSGAGGGGEGGAAVAVGTVTSPINRRAPPGPVRELSKSGGLREMARAEVLETEQTYVKNLGVIVSTFHTPLKAWMSKSVPSGDEDRISEAEMNELFGQIEMLLDVSKRFLADLKVAYSQGEALGPVFLQFAPFLKLYAGYVTTYEAKGEVLEALEMRPSAAAFIAACELQPAACGTSLRRFLSLPLLRVPQYKLLLREVLKHTKEEHPARGGLELALAEIDKVAHTVNSSIATHQRHVRESELRTEWQWDGLDDAARKVRIHIFHRLCGHRSLRCAVSTVRCPPCGGRRAVSRTRPDCTVVRARHHRSH